MCKGSFEYIFYLIKTTLPFCLPLVRATHFSPLACHPQEAHGGALPTPGSLEHAQWVLQAVRTQAEVLGQVRAVCVGGGKGYIFKLYG